MLSSLSTLVSTNLKTQFTPYQNLNWTVNITGTSWSGGFMDASLTSGLLYVAISTSKVVSVNLIDGSISNLNFITGLSTVHSCIVVGNYLYVSQNGSSTITKYDLSGNLISGWTCSAPGCSNMASDGTYIYTISTTLYKILRINLTDGTCINWSIGITGLNTLTFYNGNLYVSINSGVIQSINLSTASLTTIVTVSSSITAFGFWNGYMYYSTSGNTIYRVNMTTLFISSYTKIANTGWALIAFNGYLYVFNRTNNTTNNLSKIRCGQLSIDNLWSGVLTSTSGSVNGCFPGVDSSGILYIPLAVSIIGTVNTTNASTSSTYITSNLISPTCCVVVGSYLYIAQYNNNLITKHNLSDGSIVNTWSVALAGVYPYCITSDGTYLFLGYDTASTGITQILLSNGSIITTTYASITPSKACLTISNGYLYVGSYTDKIIYKILISTPSTIISSTLTTNIRTIAFYNNYLYLCNGTNISQLNTDLTVKSINYATTTNICYGCIAYNGFLWITNILSNTQNYITKVQLA